MGETMNVHIGTVNVSRHARERFREHHPNADDDALRCYVRYGEAVNPDIIASAFGWRRPGEDTYVLSPDRRGVFVIKVDVNKIPVVITYYRLGLNHQKWAAEGWPTTYEG